MSAGQLLLEVELALPPALPLAALHPLPSCPGGLLPQAPPAEQLRPLHLQR
jgi:hypothetical protein